MNNTIKIFIWHIGITFFCILFSGCSRDMYQSNNTFDIPLDYNLDENLDDRIGLYSRLFVNEIVPDCDISIEYNHHPQAQFSVLMLGDMYRNQSESTTGMIKISNLEFEGYLNKANKLIFTPPDGQNQMWPESGIWTQELDIQSFVSKDAEISLELNGEEVFSQNVGIYGPSNFTISNAESHPDFRGHLVVNKSNVNLTWTLNPNNVNGIIMVMRASGVDSNDVFEGGFQPVTRMMLLEDDGSQVLPVSLFEGLPTGAMVDLEMWRGDMRTVTGKDGGLFHISIFDRGFLPIILK